MELGKLFIQEQTRLFSSDHLYAADTFIEMPPPNRDPAFLDAMGKAVYEAMRVADPEAVWVLQGWLFVNAPDFWQPVQGRALFGAVPDDRLLALDLYCENTPVWSETEAFYGKPWIWCVIQDFGGTVSLHGSLPRISTDLATAMASPQRRKLSGIGLIFEGRDYNPIVQDFVTDMTWRREVPNLDSWGRDFVRRRYGQLRPASQEAWQILRRTAFTQVGRTDTLLCSRPNGGISGGTAPYDPALRQWSGMFNGFYGKRWEKFIDGHRNAITAGKPFDAAAFDAGLRAWEEQWCHQTEAYRTHTRGDPVAVARRLLAKYKRASL